MALAVRLVCPSPRRVIPSFNSICHCHFVNKVRKASVSSILDFCRAKQPPWSMKGMSRDLTSMEIIAASSCAQQVHKIDAQSAFYYLAFLESNQNQEQQWPFQINLLLRILAERAAVNEGSREAGAASCLEGGGKYFCTMYTSIPRM